MVKKPTMALYNNSTTMGRFTKEKGKVKNNFGNALKCRCT
jgi:hypothetical protein